MSKAQQQARVDRFNRQFCAGAPVYYRKDDDSIVETRTRTEAQLLSGHTAVVWLDNVRGCVIVDRVSARSVTRDSNGEAS